MKKRKNKLDQVTNALKNEPILAGPSQELIDATLAKLAAETEKAPPEPVEPVKTINLTKRFAAVAVAAAIIFVVALIAVKTLTGPDEVPAKQTAQQPPIKKTLTPDQMTGELEPAQVAAFETELEKILQMAIANDIDGLVAMLTEGQPQSRLLAANILAIVGDPAAIPALEKLSVEYGKDKPNNPYAAVIDKIKTRLETPTTASLVTAKAPIAKFTPKGVLSGLITDAKTGRPISEVKVDTWINRYHTAITDANGFYYFDKITEPGSYKIKVTSSAHIGIDWDRLPIVELSKDTQIVKHFSLEPACQIDIQVINEQNEPIEKVRIIATSLADQRRSQINQPDSRQTNKDGFLSLGGFAPAKLHT